MALGGTLILENFSYGVSLVELPLFDNNDEPLIDEETGEQRVMNFKILHIEPASGVRVEIRVAEPEWDTFLQFLAEEPEPVPA